MTDEILQTREQMLRELERMTHPTPTAAVERVALDLAQKLVERRGFGWYDDPMEGGQDAYDICQETLDEARFIVATLRAEPLPEDVRSVAREIYFTFGRDGERAASRLVLADRQRAVEAERDACEKIIEAYPAEEPFGREYEAGGLIRHGQNCAVRDILEAIRARAEQDTPANG